jgi:predicted nucleotide-binding protein
VARIHAKLIPALRQKLQISKQYAYQLISNKARKEILPRNLAAIAVAADAGLNISKFASAAELQDLRAGRQTAGGVQQPLPSIQVSVPTKRSRAPVKKRANLASTRRGTSVFVVHGRNEKLRKSLFGLLRALALQPIEWRRAIELTGKPNPYVGEILDAAFREAAAVVVLLTPDDEAKLRTEFVKANDPVYERRLTGQARPNVLFEAGMAMGRNPDSTVLVQVGEIRPFSDIGGRHVVHLSNAATTRSEFATKLANAGCNVNTTSGTDWLTEGDFDID